MSRTAEYLSGRDRHGKHAVSPRAIRRAQVRQTLIKHPPSPFDLWVWENLSKPRTVPVTPHHDPIAKDNQCWNNAYQFVRSHDGCKYVLGYYFFRDVRIEHAFVLHPELGYIDTTPIAVKHDYYQMVAIVEPEEMHAIGAVTEYAPTHLTLIHYRTKVYTSIQQPLNTNNP